MTSKLFHALVVVGSSMAGTAMVVGTTASVLGACGDTPAVRDGASWPDIGVAWWPDIGMPPVRDLSWWPDISVPTLDLSPPRDTFVIIDIAPPPHG